MNSGNIPSIQWNKDVKLVLSDVDETIADVYTPAEPQMIHELALFLQDGGKLFMVTGGSLQRVRRDITDKLPLNLRKNILVSHCSGAEVWGFNDDGSVHSKPFYSMYESTFDTATKQRWRTVVDQVINEFSLRTHPAQPKVQFWQTIGRDPLDIMLDDRGPQITLEVVNGTHLTESYVSSLSYVVPITNGAYDLRIPLMNRFSELLQQQSVPITPRLGGNFALDLAVEGVSKTTSIQRVLSDETVLASIGLSPQDVQNPDEIEIWGDKFSITNGGTDTHMSRAVASSVRSIDFRQEDTSDLPTDFALVVWDGTEHLHHGLLEYLQSRHT